MHVLSTAQFRAHLQLDEGERVQRILDIGAGDGNVTAQLAPLCHSQVDVTETNPVMCMRLQMRGYTVYGRDNWQKNGPVYDVVSCLNVLDRCEDPVALMQTMLRSLTPGGKLLIALALPYNPWIDEGEVTVRWVEGKEGAAARPIMDSFPLGKRGRRPARPLAVRGRTFTEAAASFVRDVAAPLGLNVLVRNG